jgi:hypothetical protein
MPTWAWIVIAAAIILAAAIAFVALIRMRTQRLRERFGPEYDRTLEKRGGRRRAEAELGSRVRPQ